MATDAGTSSIPTAIVSAPASAATSASYPPCAETCLADATGSLPCAESDSACLCLHASIVETSVTSCLNASGACSAGEATSAAKYYNDRCLRLGFPTSEEQSAVTGPILTATGNPIPESTHSPAASDPEPSSSSSATTSYGLSVPATAGIAVGATFLLVCIITFLAFLYIRKRSNKVSNPTVTIESFDPSNPNNRLRQTVSLRQSALYDLDDPEWCEKLSSIRASTNNDKRIEHELCHIERKGSTPQTPNTPISHAETLTNNSFTFYKEDVSVSLQALPAAAKIRTASPVPFTSQQPSTRALERSNRPPSITFLPSKSMLEASLTVQSLPCSRRVSVDQKSPAVTVFSDAASFHNATASHSRATSRDTLSDLSDNDTDSEVDQVSVIQHSRPTTFKTLASSADYTSNTSNDSTHEPLTRSQFLSKFPSGTTITTRPTAKPAPLALYANTESTSLTSPTSTYSRHASIHPKLSQNPLSQHPSPATPTHSLSPLSPRAAAATATATASSISTSTSTSSSPPHLPSTPTQPFTFRPTSSQLATPTQRSPPANMSLFPRTTTTTTTTNPSSHASPSIPPTTMNSLLLQGYTRSTALDPGPPAPAPTYIPAPTISCTLTRTQPIHPSNSKLTTADATTANTKILSGSSFGTFDFELANPRFSDGFVVDFEAKRV